MNPDNHTWDLLVGALKGTLGEAEQREFDRWAAEAENRPPTRPYRSGP